MRGTAAGLLTALCLAPVTGPARSAEDGNEALWKVVREQQRQIEALAAQLERSEGAAASGIGSRFKFGGYGELHYNNLSGETSQGDRKEIDFHRFILYTGYDFSDRIRFRSELELEHALVKDNTGGTAAPGEVELEQAYLEFDLAPGSVARGGIILVPAGIINETHEPPTFYGVERNDVESIIIPATWWGGGASLTQRLGPAFSLDVALHEGLSVPATGPNAFRIRSGRQKTSEAGAGNLAGSARLRFARPGLELAVSAQHQSDASQAADDGLNEAQLYAGHAVVGAGPFAVRALYARWELHGAGPRAVGADVQSGWYVEPSVKLGASTGVYLRYQDLDAARTVDRFAQWEAGVSYWPHPDVVIKADLRSREHALPSERGRDFDGFDLGIGYRF